MEVSLARGSYPNLKSRLDEADNKQRQNTAQLAEKANKIDLTTPFNFKGSCLSTSLPSNANINDTYYCTDLKYRKTWNGSEWFQSSMDESYYTDELSNLKNDLSFLYGEEKVSFEKINDKVIKNDLSIADLTGFCITNAIKLKVNQSIKFLGKGFKNGNVAIALCDFNGNILRNLVPCSSDSFVTYEYTATSDCYVRLCSIDSIDNVITFYKNKCKQYLLSESGIIKDVNILDEVSKNNGFCSIDDGSFSENTKYIHTDFIKISTLKDRTVFLDGIELWITLFDKNKTFITGDIINSSGRKPFYDIVDTNAYYVIFSIKKEDLSKSYIPGYKIDDSFIKNENIILEETNILAEEPLIKGYINPTNGNINTTDTSYVRTDYIPVSILSNKTIQSNYEILISLFDNDKNFVSGYWTNISGNKPYYTIKNADYVVFSVKTTDIDNIYLGRLKINKYYNYENFYKERVLCIGDSLTFGGTSLTSSTDKNYPYYLEKHMNCITYNHGRSGETAQTWWNKWRTLVNYNIKYDIVLIMLGTNGGLTDTLNTDVEPYDDYNSYADTTTGCYCKIIEEVMKNTNYNAQIFLIIPPYHHYSDEKFEQLQNARNVIPKIAERYCLPVIDAYRDSGMNKFNGHIYRAIDNLHFNEDGRGFEKLATLFASQIKAKRSFVTAK